MPGYPGLKKLKSTCRCFAMQTILKIHYKASVSCSLAIRQNHLFTKVGVALVHLSNQIAKY